MLLEECEVLRPTIEPENMTSTLDNQVDKHTGINEM